MNITAVCFAHAPTPPALKVNIPALYEIKGRNEIDRVVIANDGPKPITPPRLAHLKESVEREGKEIHTLTTKFNRRGNLVGWECVIGMLEVMKGVCERFGVPGVLKWDADTLVTDLEWLDAENHQFAGFCPGQLLHCAGLCYYIGYDAIVLILESMMTRYRWRCNDGEDRMISAEIFGRLAPQHYDIIDWEAGFASAWQWGLGETNEKAVSASVVTFGNPTKVMKLTYSIIASTMTDLMVRRSTGLNPEM
jgi:hypothetical protein